MSPDSVHALASASLLARTEELALAVTDALYDSHPDLQATYGEAGRAKCLQDTRHTLEHLASAVALVEPDLFVGYVAWLVDLLRPRGIPVEHVRGSLEATRAVLSARLSVDESAAACAPLHTALASLPARQPA